VGLDNLYLKMAKIGPKPIVYFITYNKIVVSDGNL